ncbi:substrate-binding domain-containing protein [Aureimonas ureilytica]|uniref:substrate-binding domain-containing protein n=1 Tax=Aureimonas ureilytica TaxID=401562 RepID=UPI0003A602CF|nr:substrate-binding domain-containing protein [Aureimonas ureilytica]
MPRPSRVKSSLLPHVFAALLLQGAMIAPACAQTIGLVMPVANDTFRDTIAAGVAAAAKAAGYQVTQTDAQGDESLQIANAKQQIADGASALVVLGLADSVETQIAALARSAKVPLVFVNHEPDHALLGNGVAYVGSEEKVAGTLETEEACRLMGGKGTAVVLIGELTHPAARTRTRYVHEVLARPECKGIEILEEQGGNWDRAEAKALMQSFLDAGLRPDGVISNNDEMALGAIDALKPAGLKSVVTGIDATNDGLEAMKAGDLSATVLQDGQAQGALSVALVGKMLAGEAVEPLNWIPFVLVRPGDVAALQAKRTTN